MARDRELEERRLEKIELRISDLSMRVAEQEMALYAIRHDGRDGALGEQRLGDLRRALEVLVKHRSIITDRIVLMDASLI